MRRKKEGKLGLAAWQIAVGLTGTGIAALIAATWQSYGGPMLESYARPIPVASRAHDYVLLVADLGVESSGRRAADMVARVIEEGLAASDRPIKPKVIRYPRPLAALIAASGDVSESRTAAEKQGRRWLEDQEGDILVWGETFEGNLELRFLMPENAVISATETASVYLSPADINFSTNVLNRVSPLLTVIAETRQPVDPAKAIESGNERNREILSKLADPQSQLPDNVRAAAQMEFAASAMLDARRTNSPALLKDAETRLLNAAGSYKKDGQLVQSAQALLNAGFNKMTIGALSGDGADIAESLRLIDEGLAAAEKAKATSLVAEALSARAFTKIMLSTVRQQPAMAISALDDAEKSLAINSSQWSAVYAKTATLMHVSRISGETARFRELADVSRQMFYRADKNNPEQYGAAVMMRSMALVAASEYLPAERDAMVKDALATARQAVNLYSAPGGSSQILASAQLALGRACTEYYDLFNDIAVANEGVSAYRLAARVFDEKTSPPVFATLMRQSLGLEFEMAKARDDPAAMASVIKRYLDPRLSGEVGANAYLHQLGYFHVVLGNHTADIREAERLHREGIAYFDKSLSRETAQIYPLDWAYTTTSRGEAFQNIWKLTHRVEDYRAAKLAFEQALAVFKRLNMLEARMPDLQSRYDGLVASGPDRT